MRSVMVGFGAALGVGSLVIGLALQEPLGNVFSGIMLLFERPVSPGDWIQVESRAGRVVEMNRRAVNIETLTREMVIVPNSMLYKTSFANLSRPTPLRTQIIEVTFSYGDAPALVKTTLLELALATPGVLADPSPVARVQKFGDFAIFYEVLLTSANHEGVTRVKDEFLTRLWYASQRAGLTIPYPIQTEIAARPEDFQFQPRCDPKTGYPFIPAFRKQRALPICA